MFKRILASACDESHLKSRQTGMATSSSSATPPSSKLQCVFSRTIAQNIFDELLLDCRIGRYLRICPLEIFMVFRVFLPNDIPISIQYRTNGSAARDPSCAMNQHRQSAAPDMLQNLLRHFVREPHDRIFLQCRIIADIIESEAQQIGRLQPMLRKRRLRIPTAARLNRHYLILSQHLLFKHSSPYLLKPLSRQTLYFHLQMLLSTPILPSPFFREWLRRR